MRFIDHLDEVAGSFRKQRLRTALTSLGIGISALTVTLMVGLGQGLQTYLAEQILALDNDRVLMVFPAQVRRASPILERLNGLGRPARRITEEDEERRRVGRAGLWITDEQAAGLRAIEGVVAVSPMTWVETDGIELVDADPEHAGRFETDFAALDNSPLVGELTAGRMPVPDADEVVLSPQYAQSWDLDPEALLGRDVVVRVAKLAINRRFLFRDPTTYVEEHEEFRARVVGLSERSPLSRVVFASLALGRAMARYQSGNENLLADDKIGFQAHVRLAPGADLARVKREIEDLDLAGLTLGEGFDEIQKVFLAVDLVLASFGVLALGVATLGIANTLLMSITERTREIGVLMALGMTRATVRRMFACEAAAIGLAGGLGGTALAVALGLAGNVLAHAYVPATQGLEGYHVFHFPPWLVLGVPVFSSLVGAVAGIYPANRAARLDPILALHHD